MIKVADVMKTAGTAVKAKAQLYIGYALIVVVMALGVLAVYNYTMRLKLDTKVATLQGKVTSAEGRVALVEEVNRQQADAIETIRGLNSVNDTMLQGLATDMEALRIRDRTTFTRLAALEKSNEAVRQYLNTVVPAPVGCVLDRSCPDADGGGVPAAQRGTSGRVQPAGAGAKQDQR